MKKFIIAAIVFSVAAISFIAGGWYGTRGPGGFRRPARPDLATRAVPV